MELRFEEETKDGDSEEQHTTRATPPEPPEKRLRRATLRSAKWFDEADELNGLRHRSRAKQMGYARDDFKKKPFIAIVTTWSDLLPCHGHMKTRVEEVKRGVWLAGGFPVELPAMALSETYMKPTPMIYRNMLAMQVEEQLRSQPVDGVVLMGGCDKTTPGLLMGALSADFPAIFVPAGPMLSGRCRGQALGSGTDMWKAIDEFRAGAITDNDLSDIEDGLNRSPGTCMSMGTASTMAAMTEALGLSLTGASSVPAMDSSSARVASSAGRRIVEMVWAEQTPSKVVPRENSQHNQTIVVMVKLEPAEF
ncbi:hypothetical protein CYMTET_56328 [Cymbomonas tetramitiformis]|uniref:Dihydroxy-acid/6-phosphogluconate dehydratase N-terminal domain-containing protein n=1 Tax=Cymbomonas tetramitiformis TaxID=36881 RepID=A0AAE0BBH4_9CHLO|nr:hypothetical protein CYMTET_56328 [Cymbomonas tetramitiformis]